MMAREVIQNRGATGLGSRVDPKAARLRARREHRAVLRETRAGDEGTPELRRHHKLVDDVTVVDNIETPVRRVTDQRRIDRYRQRGLISDRQWRAADKIAATAFRSGLLPRVTARYSDMPRNPGGEDDVATTRDLALHDYRAAMAAIGVVEWEELPGGRRAPIVRQTPLASVVVAVCVLDESAGDWARRSGRYSGKAADVEGMTVLRLALDALAGHWRMR